MSLWKFIYLPSTEHPVEDILFEGTEEEAIEHFTKKCLCNLCKKEIEWNKTGDFPVEMTEDDKSFTASDVLDTPCSCEWCILRDGRGWFNNIFIQDEIE